MAALPVKKMKTLQMEGLIFLEQDELIVSQVDGY